MTLPINLNQIGINIILNDAVTTESFNTVEQTWNNCNNCEFEPEFTDFKSIQEGTVITFHKPGTPDALLTYTFSNDDSISGAHGAFYRVTKDGRNFGLKIQKIGKVSGTTPQGEINRRKIAVVKEAIINYIIFETSKYSNHYDCPYCPEIYVINTFTDANDNEYCVYISEKLESNQNLNQKLYEIANPSTFITKSINRIARKLDVLWTLYKFNHCDLHSSNVLYKDTEENPNFKLIDFGESVLTLSNTNKSHSIEINCKNHLQKSGRDLFHLLWSLKKPMNFLDGHPFLDETIVYRLEDSEPYEPRELDEIAAWFDNGLNIADQTTPEVFLKKYNKRLPVGNFPSTCSKAVKPAEPRTQGTQGYLGYLGSFLPFGGRRKYTRKSKRTNRKSRKTKMRY